MNGRWGFSEELKCSWFPNSRACELIETRPVFRPSNKDLRQENGRFFQLIHKLSRLGTRSSETPFRVPRCSLNAKQRCSCDYFSKVARSSLIWSKIAPKLELTCRSMARRDRWM